MKRVLNLVKRGVKWYVERCATNYYWAPTGYIPIIKE